MSRHVFSVISPLLQAFRFFTTSFKIMLQPGTPAPDFSLQDQNGMTISLSDFNGKKLAIFFYPKDNTPTCTEQACSLRDGIPALRKKKISVIGVSMDSV